MKTFHAELSSLVRTHNLWCAMPCLICIVRVFISILCICVEIETNCDVSRRRCVIKLVQVLNQLEQMKSSVRDPYSRQTRLTLTQMIRKKAAENKKMAADLQRAQVSYVYVQFEL